MCVGPWARGRAAHAPYTPWPDSIPTLRLETNGRAMANGNRPRRVLSPEDRRFFRSFKMTRPQFAYLLDKIKPMIMKRTPDYNLLPRQKLAICMRFLTSGKSIPVLARSFELSTTATTHAIFDVCMAINRGLRAEVLPEMQAKDWKKISNSFWDSWVFPNCLGAIKAKRVPIKKKDEDGPNSVVLIGIVDSDFRFIDVDIGPYFRTKEGGVLSNSQIGKNLAADNMNIPEDAHLPGTDVTLPYVLVGGEGFPLKPYLMTPYSNTPKLTDESKMAFNFRLSHARRAAEHGFDMLSRRFQVFTGGINMHQEAATLIIWTTVVLHNFIHDYINRRGQQNNAEEEVILDSALQRGLLTERVPRSANDTRDSYASYFCSPVGSARWREENIYI